MAMAPLVSGSPRVSVIIPAYNCARFLPQALDSVLDQNYDNFEILVVDDGSTDDTKQMLRPYEHRVCYSYQENAGSAAARNRGLDSARGEYIVFLDADDFMLPGKLRQQAAYLALRPELGYVHSGWRKIDEKGNPLNDVEPWHDTPQLDLEAWLQYKPVQLGAMMFRRVWLDSVGGLDASFRQSHDVDLLLRLSLAGCRGEWLYRPTICYRQYDRSTMRRHAPIQAESLLSVLDKFFALPNVPDEIHEQKSKTYYYGNIWLAWHLYRSGCPDEMMIYLGHAKTHEHINELARPFPVPLDWLFHFATWHEKEGLSIAPLRSLWPMFEEAAGLSAEAWSQVEEFMNWWLERKLSSREQPHGPPHDLWPVYVGLQRLNPDAAGISADIALDWWVDVWSHYLEASYDAASQGLSHFSQLSDDQLASLASMAQTAGYGQLSPSQINQLWHDARDQGLLQTVDDVSFCQRLVLQRPLVSIIIPAFNNARYISIALDSIFGQNFKEYEILVIDDGSTDDTKIALRPYRGQIRYVYQENQGVSVARNEGLRRATGKYVKFLDSDDALLPDKLAEQVAQLEAEPDLDVVHSGWQLIDQQGAPIYDIEPWHDAPILDPGTWLMWKPVFLGAMLFRRTSLSQSSGFKPGLKQAEDTDFIIRLSLAGAQMAWMEEATVCYRQHDGNVMHNVLEQAQSLTGVLDEVYGLPQLPPEIREMEMEVRFYSDMWLVWRLYRAGHHDQIADYLRRTLAYLPEQKPPLIVQRWLVQMVGYARGEGLKAAQLSEFLPIFLEVLTLEPAEWVSLQEAFNWWLANWPSLVNEDEPGSSEAWSLVYEALHLEEQEHVPSARQWLAWWMLVWRNYLDGDHETANQNMGTFQGLSMQEIVRLAQASILSSANEIEVEQISQIWLLITGAAQMAASAKVEVTALYLTYFGQALLGRHWRLAWLGLSKALMMGLRVDVMRAWFRFIRASLVYGLNRRKRRVDALTQAR